MTDPENILSIIYFNKYSEKIGIRDSPSRITVPGFLFEGRTSFAYLNKEDRLVSQIRGGQTVTVRFDSEPLQDWLVEVKASVPGKIRAELKQNRGSVSIELVSESLEPVEIEEVVLRSRAFD